MPEQRVLIVDDEPLGRERVRTLLERRKDPMVITEASNRREAVELLTSASFDLVFLDIQMPHGTGFDVVTDVGLDTMPPVIFVTAHNDYAVKAFEIHALDYLLKPFTPERFYEALDRAIAISSDVESREMRTRIKDLLDSIERHDATLKRIMVRTSDSIQFIHCNDIDWIESAGNYVKIWTGNKGHLIRQTMKSLEERLDGDMFLRIHRSTIVNIEQVQRLSVMFNGDYRVHLKGGKDLTLSRSYRHVIERFT